MTGPEHYRRAQVLAETGARDLAKGIGQTGDTSPAIAEAGARAVASAGQILAAAQVHATLALAAATAAGLDSTDSNGLENVAILRAWHEVGAW